MLNATLDLSSFEDNLDSSSQNSPLHPPCKETTSIQELLKEFNTYFKPNHPSQSHHQLAKPINGLKSVPKIGLGSCAKERLLSVRLQTHNGHLFKVSKHEPRESARLSIKKMEEGGVTNRNLTTDRNRDTGINDANTVRDKDEGLGKQMEKPSKGGHSKGVDSISTKASSIKEESNTEEKSVSSSRKQIKSLTLAMCGKDSSPPKVHLPTLGVDNKLSLTKLNLEVNKSNMLSLASIVQANKEDYLHAKDKSYVRPTVSPLVDKMGRSRIGFMIGKEKTPLNSSLTQRSFNMSPVRNVEVDTFRKSIEQSPYFRSFPDHPGSVRPEKSLKSGGRSSKFIILKKSTEAPKTCREKGM